MTPRATVTVDLGFGDAGKGSIVDYLCRTIPNTCAVVRYNGGPQAAHRVVLDDGREHVFAQFGSGTFVPGVRTFLSDHMLINPANLFLEEVHLRRAGVTDALSRLDISPGAVLITPYHIAVNRIRELFRGANRHGSCGQGIGETRNDALTTSAWRILHAVDTRNRKHLEARLRDIRDRMRNNIQGLILSKQMLPEARERIAAEFEVFLAEDSVKMIADIYERISPYVVDMQNLHLRSFLDTGHVVFEGAQGVLLDEKYGFHPYTTWTDTTTGNALRMLTDAAQASWPATVKVLGIVRAYGTRHGPGPFPTEDETLTAELPDTTNQDGRWQGAFRVGHFDVPLLKYAVDATGGVDEIAVTCLDRIQKQWPWHVASRYYIGAGQVMTMDSLRPCNPRHEPIAYGERLTRQLEMCTPDLVGLDPSPEGYKHLISEAVGVPVTITSHGPTASAKREHLDRPGVS